MQNSYGFLSEKEKENIMVGFSQNSFIKHNGISGLKYFLIVMYLRKHVQTFGEVSFTLNNLLEECGYCTNTHNNAFYDDVRKIISEEIILKGYAVSSEDILKIKPKTFYTLNLSSEKSIFHPTGNFVLMSIKEFETIVNSKIGTINKSILIGVYLYIKQFIFSNKEKENALNISFPSKKQMQENINISISTIESAIKVLESLKLLYVKRELYIEDIKNKGTYIPIRNVFALDAGELNDKKVIPTLENFYGRKIYKKDEVEGKIKFLTKE